MPKLVPTQKDRQIYAFVGGSFRPPNYRHWQMISYFADMVGNNGEVIVVVSNPKSSKYQNDKNHAFEDGRTVTTEEAVKVLEIFRDASGKNNITIMESEEPSPVRAIYGMIEDPDVMSDCDVLVCCYKDDADFKKWERLEARVKESNPTVTILDYKKYALRRSYENFAHGISQLQRRLGGIRLSNEEDAMPSFLNPEQVKECMEIIYHGDINPDMDKLAKDKAASGNKPEGKQEEKKVDESSPEEDSIDYENINEFLSDWKDYNKELNVCQSSEIVDGSLVVKFLQPSKNVLLTCTVNHYNDSDPEKWKSLVEETKNEYEKTYETPFDFVSDVVSHGIDGDSMFLETCDNGTKTAVAVASKSGKTTAKFLVKFNSERDIDWLEEFCRRF